MIAWMIERRRPGSRQLSGPWLLYKLAGSWGDCGTTRASARKEAAQLQGLLGYRYRAAPYLPRIDSTGRQR